MGALAVAAVVKAAVVKAAVVKAAVVKAAVARRCRCCCVSSYKARDTTYNLPLPTYYSPLTTYYLLLTTYYLLLLRFFLQGEQEAAAFAMLARNKLGPPTPASPQPTQRAPSPQ